MTTLILNPDTRRVDFLSRKEADFILAEVQQAPEHESIFVRVADADVQIVKANHPVKRFLVIDVDTAEARQTNKISPIPQIISEFIRSNQ